MHPTYSIRIIIHATFIKQDTKEILTDSGVVEFPSVTPPEDVLIGANIWAVVAWLRARLENLEATSRGNWILDTVTQRVFDSKITSY